MIAHIEDLQLEEKKMEIDPVKNIIMKVVSSKGDYTNISPIVTDEILMGWEKTIANCSPPEQFITKSKFNLLTTLFIAQYEKEYRTEFEPYKQAMRILTTLNEYLTAFPTLLSDDTFKAKITNLGGYNFLSTLSELSLARFLLCKNYKVTFESKYRKQNRKDEKDVDLKIVDESGNVIFIEIYTPTADADINGFFSPQEFTEKLKNKLVFKATDKFADIDYGALSGKRLLAANTLFSDMFSMNIRFFNCDDYFNQLIRIMPDELDGVLIFEDNFASDNSLRSIKMMIRT